MEKLPLGAVLRTPKLTTLDLQPNTPHRFGHSVGANVPHASEGKCRQSTSSHHQQQCSPEEERARQRQLQEGSRSRLRKMILYKDDHVMFVNKPSGLPVQVGIAMSLRATPLHIGCVFCTYLQVNEKLFALRSLGWIKSQ